MLILTLCKMEIIKYWYQSLSVNFLKAIILRFILFPERLSDSIFYYPFKT